MPKIKMKDRQKLIEALRGLAFGYLKLAQELRVFKHTEKSFEKAMNDLHNKIEVPE